MEKNNNIFYDTSSLSQTPGIRRQADAAFLQSALGDLDIKVISVSVMESGVYRRPLMKITGLPPFVEVQLKHRTGVHEETLIVWSPLAWNDRFIGTGGGGTGTGGVQYIMRPDNTSRGQTLPKAILNGFTAATTDAGNGKRQWAVENGSFDWERYENWRSRSTHFMTVIGKKIAEILHGRPVQYSYFHGGSGGGRQAMVEAQEWPEDYNGIWASCPAIHWPKFLPEGYWPVAVMNDARHILTAKKLALFSQVAREAAGGNETYYRRSDPVCFDPFTLVGHGGITQTDAQIVSDIWRGPTDENGRRLWYGFRPGVPFWNVGIPIGAFYYQLLTGKPRPFFLSTHHLRWVRTDEKATAYDMSRAQYRAFFRESVTRFASAMADDADLSRFRDHGGKLLIDHGTCDPLIPVDGTLDYYERVCSTMGGKGSADRFCRVYITPGDGHGNCRWHGPGLTERTGMDALVRWMERGESPAALPTVQVDKNGHTLQESMIKAL